MRSTQICQVKKSEIKKQVLFWPQTFLIKFKDVCQIIHIDCYTWSSTLFLYVIDSHLCLLISLEILGKISVTVNTSVKHNWELDEISWAMQDQPPFLPIGMKNLIIFLYLFIFSPW